MTKPESSGILHSVPFRTKEKEEVEEGKKIIAFPCPIQAIPACESSASVRVCSVWEKTKNDYHYLSFIVGTIIIESNNNMMETRERERENKTDKYNWNFLVEINLICEEKSHEEKMERMKEEKYRQTST